MDFFLNATHGFLELSCQKAYIRYWQHVNNLKQVQQYRLSSILKQQAYPDLDYVTFAQHFPLTTYKHWKRKIEQHILHHEHSMGAARIQHYQSAMFEQGQTKFIPNTDAFINELDRALSVWIVGLYQQYPQLKKTTQYWEGPIGSQLEMPQQKVVNNMGLSLSTTKRILNDATRAVPVEVGMAKNEQDRLFATAVYLVADQDLGLISVWKPQAILDLLNLIQQERSAIIQVLRTGCWQRTGLSYLPAPKACEQSYKLERLSLDTALDWLSIWPKLTVISCQEYGQAHQAKKTLQHYFPNVNFEIKGIWREEGIVTLPFQQRHPLAYQSHFYEFIELNTQRVIPSWQLKSGDVVCPILTTGSGLIRYVLHEILEVTEFYMQIPCFKYLGSHDLPELYEQGINSQIALQLLDTFKYGAIRQHKSQNKYSNSQQKLSYM